MLRLLWVQDPGVTQPGSGDLGVCPTRVITEDASQSIFGDMPQQLAPCTCHRTEAARVRVLSVRLLVPRESQWRSGWICLMSLHWSCCSVHRPPPPERVCGLQVPRISHEGPGCVISGAHDPRFLPKHTYQTLAQRSSGVEAMFGVENTPRT